VRKVEKVPAWLGRLSTEFANALKSALLPEPQEHTKLLPQHHRDDHRELAQLRINEYG
jgi:hypothetical protein